jgi:hypothetical protein
LKLEYLGEFAAVFSGVNDAAEFLHTGVIETAEF